LLKRLQAGPVRLDRAWLLIPAVNCTLLLEAEAAGLLQRQAPTGAEKQGENAVSSLAGSPTPAPPLPDRATRELCSAVFADVGKRRGGIFVATTAAWPAAAIEQLVNHTITMGQQALLLLPHPGRPDEAVRRLLARFPGALSLGGTAGLGAVVSRQPPLTIGGRWTPLAAFARLGLVLVIDEHDPAYAGLRAPFVHGREVALQAARFARATTVLFSPNPDPATLWRASRAGIRRFTLGSSEPVSVQVVDLRQELRTGRNTLLTDSLHRALAATVGAGEQAVLFLNRRGAASMLVCRTCGRTLQCARCSTALAYHADEALLRCHCCSAAEPRSDTCPRCKTPTLDELGAGVQRLALEVQRAFPTARLARWDSDVAPGGAGRTLARRFASREFDVLVGTLPVALADGLPHVALAAAVLADLGLHLPDYRAAERGYEQLSALRRRVVAGGQLILQTYHPSHWVVQALATDDAALFYGEELRRRQELGYPPFRQLARLTCRATSRQRCEAEVQHVRAALLQRLAEAAPEIPDALLGPAPAYLERVDGVYRWQLHLRAPNVQQLLSVVPPHWLVEVDPEELR
jgi:primosomal protein N' (replication factor Y)